MMIDYAQKAYSEIKNTEEKIPEDFEKLLKLSEKLKNYEQKNDKASQKISEIDEKLKNIMQQVNSKLFLDETKFATWSPEEVVRSEFCVFETRHF